MKTLNNEQKYRLALFALLCVSSLVCVAIWAMRVHYSDEERFAFLIWNLFLAWIPLGFAWLAYTIQKIPRPAMYLLMSLCAVLWLLFLPNAPYILTDMLHLAQNRNTIVPVWYDVLMLVWFSWNGLVLGLVSMYLIQASLNRIFSPWVGWVFASASCVLSGFGIYLGRFLRWNSWDVLSNPKLLAVDILDRILYPAEHLRTVVFTSLFGLFLLFAYLTLYLFARLVSEHQAVRAWEIGKRT